MKFTMSRTLCMVFCSAVALSPSFAQASDADNVHLASYSQDVGASERVKASGLLRVLSQEAANAACHVGNGISVDEGRDLLTEVKGKFDLTLDALEFGNPTMNINGAEKRRKTIEKISAVRSAWDRMKDASYVFLENADNAEALGVVKLENEAVLEAAALLTNEVGGAYSNPAELLQTDVLLLDFTSRQAMQTQKMGKLACAIWAGDRNDKTIDDLTATMGLYDATLNALINGMPAMGILAAPTPEISDELKNASIAWKKIEGELKVVLASAEIDDGMKSTLFSELNDAMRHMLKIEQLYVVYAKHKYIDTTDPDAAKALTD
ncbi:MAG: type IV pili methyl-accepting chemotaxis transducer N-terminal domain-containing protein [Pseudomonadota bacterium]